MAWKVGHPLERDGTNQQQRLPAMLRPENVPVDSRSTEELLAMLYRLAKQFAYFNLDNEIDGSWRDFFPQEFTQGGELTLQNIRSYLFRASQSRDNGPFMSIMLAFLHLYRHLQQDINRLSGEHLKYYYEQILRFKRRAEKPDRAHVIFELSSSVKQHLLPTGSQLKAGKDQQGNALTYVTERDIVLNQTRVAALKSILIEPEGGIFAAEFANSADGLGAPLLSNPPAWPAFGSPSSMQGASLGFALASQLFELREGQRRIELSLHFQELPTEADLESIFARLIPFASGESAWLELQLSDAELSGNNLTLTILAEPEIAPIVAFNSEALDGGLDTVLPVIKLMLDTQRPAYARLKNLQLLRCDVEVSVSASSGQTGLQQLVVENDEGLLDAKRSFQAFGNSPSSGSRLTIGSREAFSKPLTQLSLQIRWSDLPTDANGFADFYNHSGYNSRLQDNSNFQVQLEVLRNGRWQTFGERAQLFSPASGRLSAYRSIDLGPLDLPLAPNLPEFEQLDVSLAQGFIRLNLNQDFGHRSYPRIFATQAAGSREFPNQPYTPTMQSLSLGYTARQNIVLERMGQSAQLFHILPFGSQLVNEGEGVALLPQLTQGSLYIGLEKFHAPQSLQLLFQALEGSADSVEAITREDIAWHYFSESGWKQLQGQEIFSDSTEGLQQPGIVALNIAKDASNNSRELPEQLHWLRLSVNKNPAGAAKLLAIHTQAATAVFSNQDNAAEHLLVPLAAEQITALKPNISAIKKVSQPYESFGGLAPEQDHDFYSRVSERLRHRQRSVNTWDYERLVLNEFPDIYKAKTIQHTGLDRDGRYNEFMPGHLSMVLIPQTRGSHSANALEPKSSVALLERVRRYLLPFGSFFVGKKTGRLHVINPRYEPIRLAFSVGFREGYDSGYYADILNQALKRQLSPWAFDDGAEITFGGKIYKSQLLAFVEQQEYVDYVTDFRMFHLDAGPGIGEMCIAIDFIIRSNEEGDEIEVASASTAASILVSANSHQINILSPGEYPCDDANTCSGIGCMYINIDFEVGLS